MHLIPVIDVRHGLAVHAIGGDRANYRPLKTPLAATSDPIAVARGFLALFTFDTLYVADLDGIEGRGPNAELPARLGDALPDVALWMDDGTTGLGSTQLTPAHRRLVAIFGSESLVEPYPHGASTDASTAPSSLSHDLSPARDSSSLLRGNDGEQVESAWKRQDDGGRGWSGAGKGPWPRGVLSLDFRGDAFLGPPELLADADRWPDRVIVMTLASVGRGAGPNLGRIAEVASRAGNRRVYAAGGVRHLGDLRAARDVGASGALVATALHLGTLKAGDLERAAGL